MRYFIEPFTQAMNQWDQHSGTLGKDWFTEYDCVGLSGGGFQCMIVPAIDKPHYEIGGDRGVGTT